MVTTNNYRPNNLCFVRFFVALWLECWVLTCSKKNWCWQCGKSDHHGTLPKRLPPCFGGGNGGGERRGRGYDVTKKQWRWCVVWECSRPAYEQKEVKD